MDISRLTQNLMKGLAQKNNAELTALSRVLDVALGKVTTAQVIEVTPVTPQERQALLAKTTEALAQLNKLANSSQVTPAVKEEITRLLEQQTLIKSPDLKWANLLVNNRQLLTYTDKPLVVGQNVPVQVSAQQKLVLLDAQEPNTTNNPNNGTSLPNSSANSSANVPTTPQKLTSTETTTASAEQKSTASEIPDENIEQKITTKNPATLTSAPPAAKIQIATVTETVPITEEERQELLKKTTEELLQLNKVARATSQSIPGLKEAIVSLQQQQAVIKSPNAKWIHIVVDGQPLLTYTDKSVAVGQKIPVQVITPQKIVLLDLPELESVENIDTTDNRIKALTDTINAALTAQKNSTPTYFAKLAITTPSPTPANSLPDDLPENNTEIISTKNPASLAATVPSPKIDIATVTETAPITPKERKELLNKTAEELAQLYKAASNVKQPIPGLKEAISSLLQQQSIIKSPDTKWIHITVNNQPLLTYSNKPLITGQKIPVQVVSPQKIALIDLPELDSVELAGTTESIDSLENKLKTLTATINSTLVAQKNATPTYFAKVALPSDLTEHSNIANDMVDNNNEHTISTKNPTTLTTAAPAPKIQIATVTETAPITPTERQELITKTNDELAELNKIASTSKQPIPGLKDAIASLLQQQAVIKSPDAKWVHININNQSLLTYSDKPLATGQTVPIQIVTPQKIVLLDTPEINPIETADNADTANPSENKIKVLNASVNTEKNSVPTYFAKLTSATESAKPQTITSQPTRIDNVNETVIKTDNASKATPNTIITSTTKANTPVTTIQTATVIKTIPITDSERQELLNKITDDLAKINKLVSSSAQTIPSIKEVVSTLLEQQALIKSPDLKWLQLSVNNQTVKTYTDKPVTTGQTIPVQVTSSEKIAILDSNELTNVSNKTEIIAANKNTTSNPSEKALPSIKLDDDAATPIPTENVWKNISNTTQQVLTPTTLEQALKNIAEKIRLQLELTQPKKATENTAKTNSSINNQAVVKESIASPNKTNTPASNTTNIQKESQETSPKLLNEISQILNGSQKQLSTELTARLLQQLISSGSEKDLPDVNKDTKNKTATNQAHPNLTSKNQVAVSPAQAQDIEKLIQQILSKPSNEISQKEVRAQLLQLMQLPSETFEKMDISKLTQHLTQGLEQKSNAELTALSKALNVALGKVVVANVTETAPVTTQERRDLLNKTTEALTQLTKLVSNPAQSTPATTAEISRLQDQQALLKSPELKWVNLLVNNRPVLTYTDKPLTVGQTLPVQLVTAQKLVLLELPQTNSNNDATKITLTNNSTEGDVNTTSLTYSAKSLAQSVLSGLQTTLGEIAAKSATKETSLTPPTTGTATTTASTTATTKITPEAQLYKTQAEKNVTTDINTQQLKKIIADNLRQLLPHKDIPNFLFSAIQQWQKLPATNQQRLVPVTVERALKSLAEQIRSPLQLTQPKELAKIIKDSGIFFENKLNATQAEATVDGKVSQNLEKTFSHDLKGSLLTLLSKVNQELNGNNKPLTTEQTAKLLQQLSSYIPTAPSAVNAQTQTTSSNPIGAQDIQLFMQELMNKPVKELSNKELRTQLLVLMQQHSIHGLAKIQLQQLASLNHELSTRDSSQPSSSLQIDIPVKHHNDVQHVHVRIDRDWVDERHSSSEENKSSTKVKQWSVTLRFDLPTLGEFCAQLAIIDTTVSATLWAAQEKTFAHVRDKMSELQKNLEKEGIQVKQLQCMKGMPPEKPMALSYSLIDVST